MAELDALFRPRAVAFVGVSPDPMKYAGRALGFLRSHGFAGMIHAVNPRYTEVLGAPCVSAVDDLPVGTIDLAFVAVAAERVPGVIAACGRKGIGAAIVASSGFRETGPEGAAREAALLTTARAAGVRLCGPNCIGVANLLDRAVTCFGTTFEEPVPEGGIGIISQSGAFASLIVDSLRRRGIGVSHMISSGNEADITTADCIRFMVADGRTRAILVYMEGLRDAADFLAAAGLARAAGIPVILLKTGRSPASRRAILSHTGSLAGAADIAASAFARHGIITVATIEDMVECAMLADRLPAAFTPGRGVGVVCIGSGGATSLAADLLEGDGLSVPAMAAATAITLRAAMPPFVTAQNPLDVAGYGYDDEADLAGVALDAFGADAGFDKLIAVIPGLPHVARCVAAVARVAAASPRPVLSVFVGGPYTDVGIGLARDAGLAWSSDLARAGRAMAAATRFGEAGTRAAPPPLVPGRPAGYVTIALAEHEAAARLAAAGVPMARSILCRNLAEARAAAAAIDYPIALKAQSVGLPHKSDAGAVALAIADEAALNAAFAAMAARLRATRPALRLDGYLVQAMAAGGVEVFVGIKADPEFGLCLLLGPGGVLVETMHDIAVAPLPREAADIEAMIDATALGRLLAGVRGRPPSDRKALVAAILSICRFAADNAGSLVELDINPLLAGPFGTCAVDALMIHST
ncbi:MAG: acetate--CoA ligase family protein [Alphaproteobacteria bacterium]|nr:acetate--CoA ligase family protein [Alphaproteobacteria bacterium]